MPATEQLPLLFDLVVCPLGLLGSLGGALLHLTQAALEIAELEEAAPAILANDGSPRLPYLGARAAAIFGSHIRHIGLRCGAAGDNGWVEVHAGLRRMRDA